MRNGIHVPIDPGRFCSVEPPGYRAAAIRRCHWSKTSATTSSKVAASGCARLVPCCVRARSVGTRGTAPHRTSPPSSNSFTPPRCSTTTWSTSRRCGAAAPPRMPTGATRPACWSATLSTRERSRCWSTRGDPRDPAPCWPIPPTDRRRRSPAAGPCRRSPRHHGSPIPGGHSQENRRAVRRRDPVAAHPRPAVRRVAQALRPYGLAPRARFQLIDDALDYNGNPAVMGKNVGDDLAEGKATLPLIHALAHADEAGAGRVRDAILRRSNECIGEIVATVRDCGALGYTRELAAAHRDRALQFTSCLPDTPFRDNLVTIARLAVERLS